MTDHVSRLEQRGSVRKKRRKRPVRGGDAPRQDHRPLVVGAAACATPVPFRAGCSSRLPWARPGPRCSGRQPAQRRPARASHAGRACGTATGTPARSGSARQCGRTCKPGRQGPMAPHCYTFNIRLGGPARGPPKPAAPAPAAPALRSSSAAPPARPPARPPLPRLRSRPAWGWPAGACRPRALRPASTSCCRRPAQTASCQRLHAPLARSCGDAARQRRGGAAREKARGLGGEWWG